LSSNKSAANSKGHVPVLLSEVREQAKEVALELGQVAYGFDGTFGRGGHTKALLNDHPSLRMIAFDQDAEAIQFGQTQFLGDVDCGRLQLIRGNFENLEMARAALAQNGATNFDFMLFDLGVSSPQLDVASRGFSFYNDGPLDMRMDDRTELTAAKIVNEWAEQDLARIFIEHGEVEFPFKVVRAIVQDREKTQFETTQQLAGLIERVDGWTKKGFHPATQYFMALRMEINRETDVVAQMLPKALKLLSPGGRLAVITFHSLEDRIVKNFFRERDAEATFGETVKRKAIQPSDEEVARNPRSRSAKLRVFRRYQDGESKRPKNKYAHLAKTRHLSPPPDYDLADDDLGGDEEETS